MFHPSTFVHLSPRRPRPRLSAADGAVLIRPASTADEPALARLAALDERPELPAGERLIGELGGRVVAALDVRTGRAVADPFVPTSTVVELLGLRAAQVRQ